MKNIIKDLAAKTGRFRFNAITEEDNALLETEPKSSTRGLKWMTVFLGVLALHVVVIGGVCVYNLVKGAPKDVATTTEDAVKADATKDATASASTTTPATTDATAENTTNVAPSEGATVATADAINSGEATPAPASTPASTVSATTPATSTTAMAPVSTAPAAAAVTATVVSTTKAASTPATVKSVGKTDYIVKGGDTLHKIALSHHMTVAQLKSANGLKSDALKIGQKLTVNGAASTATATTVATTAPASTTPATTTASGNYTIVKGDTLTKIAKAHHTSATAIMAANKNVDPKKLKIGETLVIPSASDRREISSQQAPAATVPGAQRAMNSDLVMNKL